MAKAKAWEVTDDFWSRVEPLIPVRQRSAEQSYTRKAVERPNPPMRRHKHLCADAGYTGAPALKVIEEHGYIPHVKGRGQEASELKRDPPGKKGQTLDCRGGTQLVQSIQKALGAVRET